jgi:hypothetical protein
LKHEYFFLSLIPAPLPGRKAITTAFRRFHRRLISSAPPAQKKKDLGYDKKSYRGQFISLTISPDCAG